MDQKYLVCLICCEEFKGGCGGADLTRKDENVQSLKQFCEEILGGEEKKDLVCFLNEGGNKKDNGRGHREWSGRAKKGSLQKGFGGDDDEKEEVTKEFDIDKAGLETKLAKFLKNPEDTMSICRDCLDLIKGVTEARLSAKNVEESVEKLQMLLLRELRRLQGRLDLFWREFEKMEETLRVGDLKFMENGLDASYSEKNEGGKKKKKKSGKLSREHLERKREILGFREKISEVFSDFHQFKNKLQDKVACNPVSRSKTAVSCKKMVDTQVQVEIKQKIKLKQKQAGKQQDHDKLVSSSPPPPPPPPPNSDAIDKEDDDNNGGDIANDEPEPIHLDNFDDNPSDNENEESKLTDKRFSLRRRVMKKKYALTLSDDSDEEKEDKKKERPSEDEDDDEYEPDEPIDDTPNYRMQIRNLLREYKPHLSQMSQFQANVVKSVLKCQCIHQNLQNRRGPENINVYQRHMVFLSYNLETQLINLKDVPIKILNQAEEEDGENGLLCTKCNFKVDESPKMQNLMYDHILAQHLNAYQCPHCNERKTGSYVNFRAHVWKCQQGPDVYKVTCDICGKTLCDQRTLQDHKWKLHMTEEEKKEALASGLVKKAPVLISSKGMEKKFQCEQCGKSFAFKASLQDHEITHQDRDSREQFICPKCGKSFLKAGYEYHSKYSVTCGEDDNGGRKETCEKCGKNFKNKFLLRKHVKEMHIKVELMGDGKPFVCATCGKAFGRKASLRKHENTHTGEKPWVCGRCGAAFGIKFSLARHEKSCEK